MAKQNSVIIDPGHGGSDPGAVYGNRREKDDTLALSYDIGNALERGGSGWSTRESAMYTTVHMRRRRSGTAPRRICFCRSIGMPCGAGVCFRNSDLIFGRGGDAETFAENINKKLAAVAGTTLESVRGRILWSSGIQHFRRFLWKLDLSTMRRTMTSSMRT
mgnify:CR=1 FL=1